MAREVHHPLFARLYTLLSRSDEKSGQAKHRRELLAGAQGRVVEVGAGNGLNFKHYPAGELPFEDGSFDVGVACLVLCSVPDQAKALAELRRVIRPGGELRFYEHVLSHSPRFARFQHRVLPLWRRVAGGCHCDRETGKAIEAAGFEIEECRRFPFRESLIEAPATPRILGIARRPA